MSTPSTATATIHHPHHAHYGYSHHQSYQPNSAHQSPNESTLTTANSRLNHAYNTYQNLNSTSTRNSAVSAKQSTTTTAKSPSPSTSIMSKPRTRRNPDWADFFKNGVPQEIIVIEDDSPPPSRSQQRVPNYHSQNDGGTPIEHASKKRRTGLAYGDAPARQQVTYSNTNTPRFDASGSGTISTDRTTSIHTTAPTSLGSHTSVGRVSYVETTTTGQKRKRITRQATADEKKRKQVDSVADAYSSYVPPPRPPIKATEVPVRVVKDPKPNAHQLQRPIDDDDGHFIVVDQADLTQEYKIIRLLGQGTFGKVVEAQHKRKGYKCAIKIIRSVQKYRDASRIELRVLSTLAQNDSKNRNKCIHLRDCFDYRNHICIVTDLLGQSVFDFLKSNAFVPFPSTQIQNFARQLLTSVAFLHDLNLIHTDLKPENILLVDNNYQTFTYNKTIPSSSTATQRTARQRKVLLDTEIRLIDFGSATFNDEYHSTVVSTRHYRAPEIILNLGWSFPCDIWSVGCILVEFFTGDALFQTHDNLEHLAMMEAVCGAKIEQKLVRQSTQVRGNSGSSSKFFKNNKLDYPGKDTTRASKNYVKAMKALTEIIPLTNNNTFNRQFLDLLKKIFVYDPSRRITAKEALKHPWFNEAITDDGTEAIRIRRERDIQQRAPHAQAQAGQLLGTPTSTNGYW